MNALAHLVTVVALAATAASASANTTLVQIDPSTPYQADVAPTLEDGSFVHRYSFDLGAPSTLVASVDFLRQFGVNGNAPFPIVDVESSTSVGLYQSPDVVLGDGNDVLLTSFVVTRQDQLPAEPFFFWEGHRTYAQTPLALGLGSNYYVQVSGAPTGLDGARYSIGIQISAVPEGASSALMLGGLAALWALRRCRPVRRPA